jgi:hypothetical protein
MYKVTQLRKRNKLSFSPLSAAGNIIHGYSVQLHFSDSFRTKVLAAVSAQRGNSSEATEHVERQCAYYSKSTTKEVEM